MTLEEFREDARRWLAARLAPRKATTDVSVFHNLGPAEERSLLAAIRSWQQEKCDAGWGAIAAPVRFGGRGLPREYERAFAQEEADFDVPAGHETFSVTVNLVAPTVIAFGSEEQQRRFVRSFLRADELCCQLFSEPGAGSDLAGLSTRAVRDGDDWIVNGQKVWSSGAAFAEWGELLARTGPVESKHGGITAFLLPMDAPGVEVRPIRQMTGGSSFFEVFLDDVRVPDSLRLGPEGTGWTVAMATLGFERETSGAAHEGVGGTFADAVAAATRLGRRGDPLVRQALARSYIDERLVGFNGERLLSGDGPPRPEGSITKLAWSNGLNRLSDVVSGILGPHLVADGGEPGGFEWSEHVLGAPGYRIAGGSDEIQRNIIGERVLGLPREPRA